MAWSRHRHVRTGLRPQASDSGFPELRKAYPCLPDPQAAKHQMIRVIDESGEDYPYPRNDSYALSYRNLLPGP